MLTAMFGRAYHLPKLPWNGALMRLDLMKFQRKMTWTCLIPVFRQVLPFNLAAIYLPESRVLPLFEIYSPRQRGNPLIELRSSLLLSSTDSTISVRVLWSLIVISSCTSKHPVFWMSLSSSGVKTMFWTPLSPGYAKTERRIGVWCSFCCLMRYSAMPRISSDPEGNRHRKSPIKCVRE